jgi:hypothetical protein
VRAPVSTGLLGSLGWQGREWSTFRPLRHFDCLWRSFNRASPPAPALATLVICPPSQEAVQRSSQTSVGPVAADINKKAVTTISSSVRPIAFSVVRAPRFSITSPERPVCAKSLMATLRLDHRLAPPLAAVAVNGVLSLFNARTPPALVTSSRLRRCWGGRRNGKTLAMLAWSCTAETGFSILNATTLM